jgi:NAD(P)H-hydrate epimerase
MRALEERAIATGASVEALMEEAGAKISAAVRQFYPSPGHCIAYFGKGNNGGDALVAARYLQQAGWEIELRPGFPAEEWSELTTRQFAKVDGSRKSVPSAWADVPGSRSLVVLDGLLGTGGGGVLREPLVRHCKDINRLRAARFAHVFALDVPTGLDADAGVADQNAVVANTTLTIGLPKAGLVADSAVNHVGRLAVLPLDAVTRQAGHRAIGSVLATASLLGPLLGPRPYDFHKGAAGRVGVVAGSLGTLGAAMLCAEGALRSGAGLITLHVWPEVYPHLASRISPEVMVKVMSSPMEAIDSRHDALAVGPGLGRDRIDGLLELIRRAPMPCVLDADALTVLAQDLDSLDFCLSPRLLTPHPAEMARLDPDSSARPRIETVETFTSRWPFCLLLKGARSIIGQAGLPASYNSTGLPGLATGGVGDLLTGICAGLAAQGMSLYDAARVGSWLVGRAGEIACYSRAESVETLRPSALLGALGRAFADLRAGVY